MTTLSQYIQSGLRLSGILGENDPVSAEQGAAGLIVFNGMLGYLRGKGIELGIPPQTSTTATLLIPEEDRLELTYVLAAFLSMDYGRTPPEHVAAFGSLAMDKFLRRAVLADRLENNASMPLGAAGGGTFNIMTGV